MEIWNPRFRWNSSGPPPQIAPLACAYASQVLLSVAMWRRLPRRREERYPDVAGVCSLSGSPTIPGSSVGFICHGKFFILIKNYFLFRATSVLRQMQVYQQQRRSYKATQCFYSSSVFFGARADLPTAKRTQMTTHDSITRWWKLREWPTTASLLQGVKTIRTRGSNISPAAGTCLDKRRHLSSTAFSPFHQTAMWAEISSSTTRFKVLPKMRFWWVW